MAGVVPALEPEGRPCKVKHGPLLVGTHLTERRDERRVKDLGLAVLCALDGGSSSVMVSLVNDDAGRRAIIQTYEGGYFELGIEECAQQPLTDVHLRR